MATGNSSSSRGLVLLLITSGFFITGLLFDYMPLIVDDHIKRTIELATNDEVLGFWSKPPVDLHSYYWLYDIANAEQFQTAGEKARVRQVGPFHFTSRIEKRILEWSPNKFRITYNATRYAQLNESHSRELLDEPLQLLNPVFNSIVEGLRANSVEMDAQSRAVALGSVGKLTERYNETLVHNITARVALLGKPAPIIAKLRRIAETFGMGARLPDLLAGGKFGYAALTNNTWQGPFEVYTGYQETARSLGELISYKGRRRLDYYEGKCNRMQASVGELRPMPLEPDKTLEVFSPNFCRIIHLQPTSQVKLREGQAINYAVTADDFASAQSNPDNRCFCTNLTQDDDHCSLEGVLDLAPCSFGAPILLSLSPIPLDPKILATLAPDFDAELLRGDVEHLAQADERAHFVILKRVGVPIKADLTVTLLMKVLRNPSFKQTANVPEVSYIPLVTVRESVTIPPKLGQIIVNLESFLSLTYHIKVVMYLTAIVLLCWLTGHHYCRTSSAQVDDERRIGGGGGGGNGGTALNGSALNGAQRRQSTMTSGSIGGGGGGQNGPGDGGGAFGALAINANGGAGAAQAQQQQHKMGADGQQRPPRLGEPEAGAEAPASGRFRRGTIQSEAGAQGQLGQVEGQAADSKRSPPSSRQPSRPGSLEAPAGAANGSAAVQEQPRGRAEAAPAPAGRQGVARMFSRVDTELRERATRADEKEAAAAAAAQETGGGGGGQTEGGAEMATSELIDESTTPDETARGGRRRHRKGWFMNVYSRFVGLLSGIRNTIQLDVGQLEVSGKPRAGSNEQQDRQLELLAGKIDSWYSGAPTSGGGGGGGDSGAPAATAAAEGEGEEGEEKEARAIAPGPMNDSLKAKRLAAAASRAAPTGEAEPSGPEAAGAVQLEVAASGLALASAPIQSAASGQKGGGPAEQRGHSAERNKSTRKAEVGAELGGEVALEAAQSGEQAFKVKARQKRSLGGAGETSCDESEPSDEEEDAGEAEQQRRDEADKVSTLRRIEAALGSERAAVSEEAGGADQADGGQTSGGGGGGGRRIAMINSSTSIDSAINSTAALNEDANSTASSRDSRVTQVAAAAATAEERAGATRAGGAQTAADSETAAGRTNQSATPPPTGAHETRPPGADGDEDEDEQIDESSGPPTTTAGGGGGQRRAEQSNKWAPAEGRPDGGAINGLASGADLPHAAAVEGPPDGGDRGAWAAAAGDNGRASKLDARNGISGAEARASGGGGSLAESAAADGDKMALGAAAAELAGQLASNGGGGGDKITSAPKSQAAPNPFYPLTQTGQLNGLVAAGGQPINVGASPATAASNRRGRPAGDPQAPRPTSPAGASGRRANNITPVTFQQQQQRIGSSRGGGGGGCAAIGGNNILNEKIISHQRRQQQPPSPSPQLRVGSAAGSNSNQGGANETTGNHHHQRVQPAGA